MITVLANGCFDPFHYGHLLHLEAAKKMGDELIVSVTRDANVNKQGRPIFDDWKRCRVIESIYCVDRVIVVSGLLEALELIKPDIVVKGKDYGELDPEHKQYCLANNIKMRFTDTPKWSSTDIINEIRRRS